MTESFNVRQAEPLLDGWECPSVSSWIFPRLKFPFAYSPGPCVRAWASHCQPRWEPGEQRSTLPLREEAQLWKPDTQQLGSRTGSVCSLDASSLLLPVSSRPVLSKPLLFWICLVSFLDFCPEWEQEPHHQWQTHEFYWVSRSKLSDNKLNFLFTSIALSFLTDLPQDEFFIVCPWTWVNVIQIKYITSIREITRESHWINP